MGLFCVVLVVVIQGANRLEVRILGLLLSCNWRKAELHGSFLIEVPLNWFALGWRGRLI